MLRLVVWLVLLGAMLYVAFWVVDRRLRDPGEEEHTPRTTPEGPRGPDDDDEFLRELDRRRRDGS